MATAKKRAGTTTTFSVSVDTQTKRALRALADEQFGGNLSALITSLAEDARRRMAAGEFLRKKGIAPLTERESDAVQAEIDRELALARRRARKRRGT